MTVDEIKHTLIAIGMRASAVSFGDDPSTAAEQCRIRDENGLWEVFYFERDKKNDRQVFSDEHVACSYILAVLKADRTVWR